MKKCECFPETLKIVEKSVVDQLQHRGTKHENISVNWEGYSYFLSGDYCPVNPKVKVEYQGFKKNGDPMRNLTKDSITITAKFCPFCGRKHLQSESGEAQ